MCHVSTYFLGRNIFTKDIMTALRHIFRDTCTAVPTVLYSVGAPHFGPRFTQ